MFASSSRRKAVALGLRVLTVACCCMCLATPAVAVGGSLTISQDPIPVPGVRTGDLAFSFVNADATVMLFRQGPPTHIYQSLFDSAHQQWGPVQQLLNFPDWTAVGCIAPDGNLIYGQHFPGQDPNGAFYRAVPSGGSWQDPGTPIVGLGPLSHPASPQFNGHYLYFQESVSGDGGSYHIWSAAYNPLNGGFSPAAQITELERPGSEDKFPWVNRDDTFMLFSSNRPGGYGGYDIYSATWDASTGKWGHVTNLGPKVNSANDEYEAVFAEDAGTLYFDRYYNGGNHLMQVSAAVVPLPAAAWMGAILLGGMGGFGLVRRRFSRY